jgi:hypothetical protein
MSSFNTIRELTLLDQGECTIRVEPTHSGALYEWAFQLSYLTCRDIKYLGAEGLAHFGLKVLTALLLPERNDVYTQEGVCQVCGTGSGSKLQRDHKTPISLCSDGEGQVLCKWGCHADKTNSETAQHKHNRGSRLNILMSYFNPHVYQSFVVGNKPLAIVRRICEPTPVGLLVDMKRCRRNILITSKYKIPVFCVLDDIRPFEGQNADFYFIIKADDDVLFTGPHWYHACVYDRLVATKRIDLQNVTHCLCATGQLKDPFDEVLQIMEKAWDKCEQNIGKNCINSIIGLMGAKENN